MSQPKEETKSLPMSAAETARQSNVSKWRQRLQNEADHGPKIFIDAPLDTDVLLGKQRDAFNHIGNRSFRSLIQDHWERYNNASGRCERTAIVVQIVEFLREERQVRFLKKDNSAGRWYIVHDSVAREKVGHAIRDAINFRRHHLRKMAAEARRDHVVQVNFHAPTSDVGDLPPQQVTSSGVPPFRPVVPTPKPIKKRKRKGVVPSPSDIPDTAPSRAAIADILGALKQTGANDYLIKNNSTFYGSTNAPTNGSANDYTNGATNDYTNDSTNDSTNGSTCRPTTNPLPLKEEPAVHEEAAMMGAFNVWASQTFAES